MPMPTTPPRSRSRETPRRDRQSRNTHHTMDGRTMTNTCATCGKPYTQHRRNATRCKACIAANVKKRTEPQHPMDRTRTCTHCASPFTPRSGPQLVCSPECRSAVKDQRERVRRTTDKYRDGIAHKNHIRRTAERTGDRITRTHVWERDMGMCHICKQATDRNDWHLDHITPLARGGTHTWDNVAVSHASCNLAKGVRTEWQAA
jgi:5-methylcytosine-specific restriction endonuclease McrA